MITQLLKIKAPFGSSIMFLLWNMKMSENTASLITSKLPKYHYCFTDKS